MALFTRQIRNLRLPLTGLFLIVFGVAFLISAFEVDEAKDFIIAGSVAILIALLLFWVKKSNKPAKLKKRQFLFNRWHSKGLFFGLILLLLGISSGVIGEWYYQKTSDYALRFSACLFCALSLLESCITFALWFEKKPVSGLS